MSEIKFIRRPLHDWSQVDSSYITKKLLKSSDIGPGKRAKIDFFFKNFVPTRQRLQDIEQDFIKYCQSPTNDLLDYVKHHPEAEDGWKPFSYSEIRRLLEKYCIYYYCLVMADLGPFANPQHINQHLIYIRNGIPLYWGIDPILYELLPTTYQHAVEAVHTTIDQFITWQTNHDFCTFMKANKNDFEVSLQKLEGDMYIANSRILRILAKQKFSIMWEWQYHILNHPHSSSEEPVRLLKDQLGPYYFVPTTRYNAPEGLEILNKELNVSLLEHKLEQSRRQISVIKDSITKLGRFSAKSCFDSYPHLFESAEHASTVAIRAKLDTIKLFKITEGNPLDQLGLLTRILQGLAKVKLPQDCGFQTLERELSLV